jgi:hypothetical protein
MDPAPEQIGPRRQMARILLRRGNLPLASEHLDRALALCESMVPTVELGLTLLVVAERHLRERQPAEALSTLERALAQGLPVDTQVEAHGLSVEACILLGDLGRAPSHAADAMRLAQRLSTPRQLGLAHLAAARLADADGDGDRRRAGQAFEAAVRVLEEAQVPYDLALALRGHGRMLMSSDRDRAQILLDLARTSFQRIGAVPDATASV